MTILIDAANTLGTKGPSFAASTTVPASMPHVMGTGSDRMLIVGIAMGGSAIGTISGVTYAGVAMTLAGGVSNGTTRRAELWYLLNPNAGTNNVVVSFSNAGTSCFITVFATGWTGVDQTTPFSNIFASATGTSTAVSVDVTTSATTDVVVDIFAAVGSVTTAPTVGASQTAYQNATGGAVRSGHSSETGSTPTVTMSWTTSSSSNWATGGRAMQASAAVSPPAAASGVTVSEISVVPLRAGPLGFDVLSTNNTLQDQETMYEAAGMYPKIIRGRIVNGAYVWDDIITLPTIGNAGRLAISTASTPSSPNGSLIVVTQDSFYQYPIPAEMNPSLTPFPDLVPVFTIAAATPLANADLLPVFYSSAWDGGDSVYELAYVHIIAKNLTLDVDRLMLTYRWDDTNKWESQQGAAFGTLKVYSLSQNDALFEIPRGNWGTVLHLAVSILDSVNTDPIGPTIAGIIAWVRELDIAPGERGNRPARATPEDS